ncbi:hypothetical protein MHYP_G00230520 [Metynnis hypsauchen]
MTVARIATMQLFILSALLFLGNSVVSGASEVVEHALVHEASLDHSGDEDLVLQNASKNPTLQPKPSPPPVGIYTLARQGRVCVRASLGVEFTVIENKKSSFFNIDPKSTRATGYCGDQRAVLSLVFDGGNLEFTFIKDGGLSYVSKLRATLTPMPPCKKCNKVECWADYTKRIIPIVLGAVVVGIILIAVLVYVLTRERRGQGYERL